MKPTFTTKAETPDVEEDIQELRKHVPPNFWRRLRELIVDNPKLEGEIHSVLVLRQAKEGRPRVVRTRTLAPWEQHGWEPS